MTKEQFKLGAKRLWEPTRKTGSFIAIILMFLQNYFDDDKKAIRQDLQYIKTELAQKIVNLSDRVSAHIENDADVHVNIYDHFNKKTKQIKK